MKIPVIRDACGNIINWFDTKEEAENELAYLASEELEVTEASVDEVFQVVFGGMSVNDILGNLANPE